MQLSRENWLALCDELKETLSTSKTWRLLRYLIDPTKSKGESAKVMATVLHSFPGALSDFLRELTSRYVPTSSTPAFPNYTGQPNPNSDSDIQIFEVKAALAKIRRNTTPGPDQITNKALANLNMSSVIALTSYMNTC